MIIGKMVVGMICVPGKCSYNHCGMLIATGQMKYFLTKSSQKQACPQEDRLGGITGWYLRGQLKEFVSDATSNSLFPCLVFLVACST